MTTSTPSFTDAIVQSYDDHLVPMIFADYARDLARRATVPAGGRVLETAAGTGALTAELRHRLDDTTTLIATDMNPAMLARAEAKLSRWDMLSFRTADGTDLPFEDRWFDAVACQFGVMFFEDRGRGYREARRVLRPGGSLVFNVWDSLEHNRLPGLVHETMVEILPIDPPRFMTIPFGYHDLSLIVAELRDAGFGRIDVSVNAGVSRASSARSVAAGLVSGTPLGIELADRGELDRAMRAVEGAVVREFGTGPVTAPMQSISFVAWND